MTCYAMKGKTDSYNFNLKPLKWINSESQDRSKDHGLYIENSDRYQPNYIINHFKHQWSKCTN